MFYVYGKFCRNRKSLLKRKLKKLKHVGALACIFVRRVLQLIGGHFMDKAIEAVKEKKTLGGTGDNWDMMIRAHHIRSTAQNQDLHLFTSNLYVNRVSFSALENTSPLNDILTCPRNLFTLQK